MQFLADLERCILNEKIKRRILPYLYRFKHLKCFYCFDDAFEAPLQFFKNTKINWK